TKVAGVAPTSGWDIELAPPNGLKELAEPVAHPPLHLAVDVVAVADLELGAFAVLNPVLDQADAGRKARAPHHVTQTANALGQATSYRQPEHLLGELRHSVEDGGATGNHGARCQKILESSRNQLAPHQGENFLHPRLDDLAQDL